MPKPPKGRQISIGVHRELLAAIDAEVKRQQRTANPHGPAVTRSSVARAILTTHLLPGAESAKGD